MGLLKGTSVYLSGPIEADPDCVNWRKEFSAILKNMGVIVYDPLAKPSWMNDLAKGDGETQRDFKKCLVGESLKYNDEEIFNANHEIRLVCRRLAYSCDWMICVLKKDVFTAGTYEELAIAERCGKPVIFYTPGHKIISMWLVDQFSDQSSWKHTFHDNKKELLQRINNIDQGTVTLDPLKWIFITYDQ